MFTKVDSEILRSTKERNDRERKERNQILFFAIMLWLIGLVCVITQRIITHSWPSFFVLGSELVGGISIGIMFIIHIAFSSRWDQKYKQLVQNNEENED